MHTMRLPLEGTHHRGDDDAWNSAAILAELLRRSREERGEPLDCGEKKGAPKRVMKW
ncbi:hypothetical protein KSC_048930 [Ktedonobacter sp. SOSP1-52]|uniref:hypothetical protein n=1 Tax=Ktedonobacter sp. SOSP1-52 TaxID=2778366 RepID=UPI001915305B|nr:hypothetical protein [Ktedonobacter sp. SOSP1-52]GHO66001.1 hypothetical protein KSC_048930 [Ktedonobacter sp. SOSP1-52]